MSTDYDVVAEEYKRLKLAPWRTCIERYSLLKLLGGVRGGSVLDLACGEGFYSRLIREQGATRVVGVDLSGGMIGLAIAAEKESPRGIEYRVGDAMAYQPDEPFDIVTAAYLLNYADTEEKLTEMCQTVARSLKPDGRFVTVNNNPSQALERYQSTRKYDFVKSIRGALQPGAAIAYTIFQDGVSFSFDNDYLSPATHERALEAVGLQSIEWRRPKLSPEWDGPMGYWDDFLDDPPVILLQCRK